MSARARVSSDGGEPSSACMMPSSGADAIATGVEQSDSTVVLYPPPCETPFDQ